MCAWVCLLVCRTGYALTNHENCQSLPSCVAMDSEPVTHDRYWALLHPSR